MGDDRSIAIKGPGFGTLVGLGALGVFGVAAYVLYERFAPSPPSPAQSFTFTGGNIWASDKVSGDPRDGNVAFAGDYAIAQVAFRNDGDEEFAPSFRLDVKGHTKLTWVEGGWFKGPLTQPGEEDTVTVYRQIPPDWGAGMRVSVKVMLQDVKGAWWDAGEVLHIPESTADDIELVDVSLYASPQVGGKPWPDNAVFPLDYIVAIVSCRNTGQVAFTPQFRLSLKGHTKLTWVEGGWVGAGAIGPGESKDIQVFRQVPEDWGQDMRISVKIMLYGIEGEVWGPKFGQGVDLFQVPGDESLHNIAILSVAPQTPLIRRGDIPRAWITYRNDGDVPLAPTFRYDIWEEGHTPQEGNDFKITPAAIWPGEQKQALIRGITIPNDWEDGTLVYSQLLIMGISGEVWASDGPAYEVLGSMSTSLFSDLGESTSTFW